MSEINSYKNFWIYYVQQHRDKRNRNLHFWGTTAAILSFSAALLLRQPYFFMGGVVAAYALAWGGHFFFERNKPASFEYPFWSVMADIQMYVYMCLQKMDREVARTDVVVDRKA